MASSGFIGVFDSGVGGISVLKALVQELPYEHFSYLGDSAHAPYGEKTEEEILTLSSRWIEQFIHNGAKAVVIACNTATSVAAQSLRSKYPEIPIIGIEPALKPAVEAYPGGTVLVMATPVTLALDKYHELVHSLDENATVIPAPCPGLAKRIEEGKLDAIDVEELISQLIGGYAGEVDAAVLGCTHYPFVSKQIKHVLGGVELFEGGAGTARQTHRILEERGLLNTSDVQGSVSFASTKEGQDELGLYQSLFAMPLE